MHYQLRLALVFARIGLHLSSGVLKVGLLFPLWDGERRRREIRNWSRGVLDIFGIDIVVRGDPVRPTAVGRLFVANHTSWLDVFALLAVSDVVFVAKSDVEKWPVIGWLASRLGTVFLERRATRDLSRGVCAVAERLQRGINMVVFPEGTTTDGTRLLPFRAALFEAAITASCLMQPVAIRYRRADGRNAEEVAFTGEMSLIRSFCNLVILRDATVRVEFLTEYRAEGSSRQSLASLAEVQIGRRLDLICDADVSALQATLTVRAAA